METVHFFIFLFVLSCYLDGSGGIAGISFGANVHCAVRKEISPCTCRHQEQGPRNTKAIAVICEGMTSFQQVVTALQGRFDSAVEIRLKISHSALDDLPQLKFQQMGLQITQLRLINDNLSALPESVFSGMENAELISFSDNTIERIPQNVLNLMPKVKTLDISRTNVANITTADLQNLQNLTTLILSSNNISLLEVNAFPAAVNKLHIGGNRIKHLNGTLRALSDLEWLFINNNQISTLDGELPEVTPNRRLTMVLAMHNRITSLPEEMKQFLSLNYISLAGNKIRRLGGVLGHAKNMTFLELLNNEIDLLESGDFASMENLTELVLDHNLIQNLNGSILPLKSLTKFRISNNLLQEFNPNELRGLTKLEIVDMSFNVIKEISPKLIENQVNLDHPRIVELRLEYNHLRNLSGGLGLCVTGIRRLNVSHNHIELLRPEDLHGFSSLQKLDISFNKIKTFGQAYQTLIPQLEEIMASHNLISVLEKELHGFPQMCWADFSYNELTDISTSLADKTQCKIYGVNSTLRIYIQGNRAICKPEIISKARDVEIEHSMEFQGFDECPRDNKAG